jgi:hypothetical protein
VSGAWAQVEVLQRFRPLGIVVLLYQRIGWGGPFIAFFAMSGELRVIER